MQEQFPVQRGDGEVHFARLLSPDSNARESQKNVLLAAIVHIKVSRGNLGKLS
jgi:hypothetical protein